jgi:Ca2+-binding EF-hand superfamily protein
MPMPLPAPHSPPLIYSPVQVHTATITHVMTRDEMLQHVRTTFARLDTNHDGYITKDELAALHGRMMGMHAAMAEKMADRSMRMGDDAMHMSEHATHMGEVARRMNPGAMFDELDTNHDGMISRQEFMAGHARMHERHVIIMRDEQMSDGKSGEEHMEMRIHGRGDRDFVDHLFAMADANHDGRISLKEAEAAMLAHFDRMDLNHDGRITPDEHRNVRIIMREHQPG